MTKKRMTKSDLAALADLVDRYSAALISRAVDVGVSQEVVKQLARNKRDASRSYCPSGWSTCARCLLSRQKRSPGEERGAEVVG
jgi:hypothetical protein